MFPLQDNENGLYTAKIMKPYLIALNLLPLISSGFGSTSYMFIIDSFVPNLLVYHKFKEFKLNPTKEKMKSFFSYSLWQILILLCLMVFHAKSTEIFYVHVCNWRKNESNQGFKNYEKLNESHEVCSNQHNCLRLMKNYFIQLCPHFFIDGYQRFCLYELWNKNVIGFKLYRQAFEGE